jgi:hypothetical protein
MNAIANFTRLSSFLFPPILEKARSADKSRIENSSLSENFAPRTQHPELPAVSVGIKHQQCANRRVDDKVDFCRRDWRGVSHYLLF